MAGGNFDWISVNSISGMAFFSPSQAMFGVDQFHSNRNCICQTLGLDRRAPQRRVFLQVRSSFSQHTKTNLLHSNSRYLYNPDQKWKKKGEFFSIYRSDGSPRWPWKVRGVHDWVSPNGQVSQFAGLAPFPDEQGDFTEGQL